MISDIAKILNSPPGWSASILLLIFGAWLLRALKLGVKDFHALAEAVKEVVTYDGQVADAAHDAASKSTLPASKVYSIITPVIRAIRTNGKTAMNLKSLLRLIIAAVLKV